jgi:hypothetical protein
MRSISRSFPASTATTNGQIFLWGPGGGGSQGGLDGHAAGGGAYE